MRRGLLTILLCGGLLSAGLTACDRGPPDEVDAEAIAAIETAVEDQLNAPAYAIMGVLRTAAQEAQVGWDTLSITPQEEPEPLGWWLQRRGLIEFSGAQFATRAAFILSRSAQELVAQPDQPWFEAAASSEPEIDCETAAAMEARGCEVTFEVTPELTPAGRAAVGSPAAPLGPIKITAVVTLGAEDWEVPSLTAEQGALSDLALASMLGTPDQRLAAAKVAQSAMDDRLVQMSGGVEPAFNPEASIAATYVEPPAPVAPAEAAIPKVTSPFRPGP